MSCDFVRRSQLSAGILLSFFALPVLAGNTYWASPTGSADAACTESDPGTIQACIDKTANGTSYETGDTIVLKRGDYGFTADDGRTYGDIKDKTCIHFYNKTYMTVRSEDNVRDGTVLYSKGANRTHDVRAIALVNSKVVFSGLTVSNFHNTAGSPAIWCREPQLTRSELIVTNCVITQNDSPGGGPLYNVSAYDSLIVSNRAYSAYPSTFKTARKCTFVGNISSSDGGAAHYGTFYGCTFVGNRANKGGAFREGSAYDSLFVDNSGQAINEGTATGYVISNCVFVANGEGAIYAPRNTSIIDCVFSNNVAVTAAAINGGTVTRGTFIGNRLTGDDAGAVRNVLCSNCYFQANCGQNGSVGRGTDSTFVHCIFRANTNFLKGSTTSIGGNGALFQSHAIHCLFYENNGSAITGAGSTAVDSVISNNLGTTCSGGSGVMSNVLFIANRNTSDNGTVSGGVYTNCQFIANIGAKGGVGQGGTYVGCLMSNNVASTHAGAVRDGTLLNCRVIGNCSPTGSALLSSKSDCTAENCVFLDNRGDNCVFSGNRVALKNCLAANNVVSNKGFSVSSIARAVNCTFADNATDYGCAGAGVYTNCLFAGTKALSDGSASADIRGGTFDHCLYATANGGTLQPSCIQTDNPRLNRGTSPTLPYYAPRRTSRAVNAGVAVTDFESDAKDLAGNGRVNGVIDIGCYEYWPSKLGLLLLVR